MKGLVALAHEASSRYPLLPPFDPEELYPEFDASSPWGALVGGAPNRAYALVRECLRALELDSENFGTPSWNPFQELVPRGGLVVIKPNFVLHERGVLRGQNCLITHASVIRPIVDYVLLAGGPECRVVIADAPLQQADFAAIVHDSGLDAVVRSYRERLGIRIELLDLRRTRAIVDAQRVIVATEQLPGDPRGYASVALNAASWLEPITDNRTRFAVTDYDRAEMSKHHGPGRHEYLISRTVLECDALINVPKLKSHQKVGATLALKNLVGINGSKDWLPHYRPGSPESGGDEFPRRNALSQVHSLVRSRLQGSSPTLMRAAQRVWQFYKRNIESRGIGLSENDRQFGGRTTSGAWHGNDTTWRMVLDLNQVLFGARASESEFGSVPRGYLAIVDGIVGGDGDGPLSPEPIAAGIIAASQDPVALDSVCAYVMGFDPDRMPLLLEAKRPGRGAITTLDEDAEPQVRSWPSNLDWRSLHLGFRPAPGWRGKLERPRLSEPVLTN